MDKKEYPVSEAVRLVGVESHVLRYWEEELQVGIRRNPQGHRVYSEEDIALFRRVRELKEKGLQLKAIRLLLDKQGGLSFEASGADGFAQQVRELAGEDLADEADRTDDKAEALCGEIVPAERPEPMQQFEQILRRLMQEVVSEQNEKLEEAITKRVREELEGFYEAAVTLEEEDKRIGRLRRALGRLLKRR